MDWAEIPEAAAAWSAAVAAPAAALQRAAATTYTADHVGWYCHPGDGRIGLHAAGPADLAACKAAAARALPGAAVAPLFLSGQDGLDDPAGCWVKAAHSPTLRRLGELLNFFPGQYPGGLPNAPSPAAAMLASGLVGAGLGWGAGRIARRLLPEGYGDGLGRTGAVLGGLAGAAPGALWGYANARTGHGLLDSWPLDQPPGTPPRFDDAPDGWRNFKAAADALAAVPVPARVRRVLAKAAFDSLPDPSLLDVDVDALGRTLWRSGASPQLAGSTMGALYAAQQLPDPRSRPGLVTGAQLGRLAQNAAGDYVTGLLVGRALNAVAGTPWSAPALGAGAAALGVIGAVVPKLFGG